MPMEQIISKAKFIHNFDSGETGETIYDLVTKNFNFYVLTLEKFVKSFQDSRNMKDELSKNENVGEDSVSG